MKLLCLLALLLYPQVKSWAGKQSSKGLRAYSQYESEY